MRALGFIFGFVLAVGQAQAADYGLSFGPFLGGGNLSTTADVRQASGYSVSADGRFRISEALMLGPRVEFTNAFVNTKAASGNTEALATYDHRIVAAGAVLSHDLGSPAANEDTSTRRAYVAVTGGQGYSKLAVDENGPRHFIQSQFGDLAGTYGAVETGAWLPLNGRVGVNLALLGSLYRLDQSEAKGTFEGERVRDDGRELRLQGKRGPETNALSDRAVFKTYAGKLTIAVGF